MLRKIEALVHTIAKTEMWLWVLLSVWLCPLGHN